MAKLITTIIVFALVKGLSAQAVAVDSSIVSKAEIKSFFADVQFIFKNKSKVVLVNEPLENPPTILVKRIFSKDSFLSNTSVDFPDLRENQSKSFVWEKDLIEDLKLVTEASLDSVFNTSDLRNNWRTFYKTFGIGFYQISIPYFSKDKKYCVLSVAYYCGSLCGEGGIKIFIKTKDGWKLHKTVGRWVS